MLRKISCLILITSVLYSCNNQKVDFETILPSPGLSTYIYFNLNHGDPFYLVYYRKKKVIGWSGLGYSVNNYGLSKQMALIDKISKPSNHIENKSLDKFFPENSPFNELTLCLQSNNTPAFKYNVIFRAYNNGIAFRYEITKLQEPLTDEILYELTEFNLESEGLNCDFHSAVEGLERDTMNNNIQLPLGYNNDKNLTVSIYETQSQAYPAMSWSKKTDDNCILKVTDLTGINYSINGGIQSPWRIIHFCNSEKNNTN